MKEDTSTADLRLDKWLWAARFFKTRQLAVEAINGGKVHVDGQRAKPGRAVHPGSRLEINKEGLVWTVEVIAVDRQRRSASEAARLYIEGEASQQKRQELIRQRRELGATTDTSDGRPTKRDRRRLERFTGRNDGGMGS